MPGGDGSGPMGRGQMSGWGRGFCRGSEMPDAQRGGRGGWYPGRGRDLGSGGGWGWRHWFRSTGIPGWVRGRWAAPDADGMESSQETEQQALEQRCAMLESELEAMRQRLDEIGAAPTETK